MSALFSFSCYLCFLVVLALSLSCISNQKVDNDVLCMEGERQALLYFKHGLIDETDRLASWVGEDRNCCRWTGIVCDNITGHVLGIHLGGNSPLYWYRNFSRQLGGNLSSSLLHLKQLRHLDLSCNDFGGIQIPEFIGSLGNLRYLDLSSSNFSGIIPPQLGNISQLHVLSLGRYLVVESTRMMNMQWLSNLRLLHHLDMSHVNLSKAIDWFQVINTLPSLTKLYLHSCDLMEVHRHVPSLNITSLSLLDLSFNDFSSFVPQWIFSITNLVSLDLSECYFYNHSPGSIDGFRNLTCSTCGVSSSVLNSLSNLTSLVSLDLSRNDFGNISLNYLLGSFLKCESHIGRSSPLEELVVSDNDISGRIPHWIGRLSSLEYLDLSDNRLDGNLPDSLGNLSKLEELRFSYNLLTGVVTEATFAKLASLNFLHGGGNNLTLRPRLANWIPPFQLWDLDLSSWSLGPQFPLWLQSQTQLSNLYIRNTGISSAIPVSFGKSFPNLWTLDMSHNHIHGTLLDIPATVSALHLNSNEFRGELPKFSNRSVPQILDLSSNFFVGSLHGLLCSNNSVEKSYADDLGHSLNLGNNRLSGVIPECWDKWSGLKYLTLENNNLSGEIPGTLDSLLYLRSLNMRGNRLSGRIPASLMNLKYLKILQLGRNEVVGSIPTWFGNLSSLRIVNLRSNNFDGNIPPELCYATNIQILDVAHNDLSGNIPRCFNNFSVLSGKEALSVNRIFFYSIIDGEVVSGSDSLVMKGREDTYNSNLGLVALLDLSSNNLVGHIPSELTALRELRSLNLSRNQLTGRIPEKIGNMNALETLDLSLNKLSGELPMSLSTLTSLSSFNVSFNFLTGRIPSSTQLQSFNESSFFGNKLCGDPLTDPCIPTEVPNAEVQKEDDASHGADWGLITSIVIGFAVGFWLIVAPLMVSRAWRIVYFRFLSELRYMVYDVMRKYGVKMFSK